MSTHDEPREQDRWHQLVLLAGLSGLGAVGVAWGGARGVGIMVGLWMVYLLLIALFAHRAFR